MGTQLGRAIGSSPEETFSLIYATLLSAVGRRQCRDLRAHHQRLLRARPAASGDAGGRRGVVLHSKTALVDGVWATVSSTNLDWRSFLHNHELNAVMLGADFGQQVQTMFDRDLAASDAVEPAAWERRSSAFRVQEWFGRLWEYWL